MKKNQALLLKVRTAEAKRRYEEGENWRHVDGILFRIIKFLFLGGIAVAALINIMRILDLVLRMDDTQITAETIAVHQRRAWFVGFCVALMIAAIVLIIFKKYISAAVLSVVSGVMTVTHYASSFNVNSQSLSPAGPFAARFTVPAGIFVVASLLLAVIWLLDHLAENRAYQKKLENIYHARIKKGDTVSNEEWEAILEEHLREHDKFAK